MLKLNKLVFVGICLLFVFGCKTTKIKQYSDRNGDKIPLTINYCIENSHFDNIPGKVGPKFDHTIRNREYTEELLAKSLTKIFSGVNYLHGCHKDKRHLNDDLFISIKIENYELVTKDDRTEAKSKIKFIVSLLDNSSDSKDILFKLIGRSKYYVTSSWNYNRYQRSAYYAIKDAILNNHFREKLTHNETISEIVKKKIEKETLPANLTTQLVFVDSYTFSPNTTIDAGEKSTISATITNQGKGTAFNVKMQTECKFSGINVPNEIKVGDIQPGETKEITIPIAADISLLTGTASFLINSREKRGYDARPLELQIPTLTLKKPELMVVSCNLNDSSGLGQGDGDNHPENNETIELAPYVKNQGIGAGLKVTVELADITPGLEVIKGNDDLKVIEPGSIGKVTLAFKVPRTFAGSEIKYTILARDVRGMETSQTYTHAFSSSSPQLRYIYQVVDSHNHEIPGLENGKSYTIRLSPKNTGNNIAEGVKVQVRSISNKVDIGNYSGTVGALGPSSQGGTISIPVSLSRSYTDRVLELDVQMTQDSFPGFDQNISLPVKVTQPGLDYQVVLLNGVSDDTLTENSQAKFRVSISNKGNLDAENVEIKFQSVYPGALIEEKQIIGTIKTGESQYKDFTFRVSGSVKLGKLPIKVEVIQSDFDNLKKTVPFNIIKQTALVQKVAGTESSSFKAKAAYTGPPEVYINSPNNNVEVFNKTINLHGSIILFGAGNDIVDFKISVNGKSLKVLTIEEDMKLGVDLITKKVEDNKIVFDGEVSLGPEMNKIKITCRDRNSQEGSQIIHVNKKAKLGNIYAVVVGVSEFANSSYNLSYAASDAKKFYDFLKSKQGGSLPDSRIKLLTNYQATRAGIIAALTKFTGKAAKEDTVQIYLATHGLSGDDGGLYYLAYDTDIDNLFGTGFSNNDLEKIVKDKIQAGRVIIYLDACHTGMAGLSSTMYAKRRDIGVIEVNQKINALATQLSKTAAGVATLSASSSTGYSLENKKWDGGIFTYCLIKGLYGGANENNDEWVTLNELDNYLTHEVFIMTDGKQKPKVNGTLIGETTVLSKVN